MNKKYLKFLLFVLITALAFVSCKVTQTYKAPEVNTNNLYRDALTTDTISIANLKWNEVFTDLALQRLIGEGIAQNLDIKIAYTRIQQAQAYYLQSVRIFAHSKCKCLCYRS